jgi:hypothetical protein
VKPPRRPPAPIAQGTGKISVALRPAGKTPALPVRGVSRAVARTSRTTASPARQIGMQLHTADGLRKYLTAGERDGFLRWQRSISRVTRSIQSGIIPSRREYRLEAIIVGRRLNPKVTENQ